MSRFQKYAYVVLLMTFPVVAAAQPSITTGGVVSAASYVAGVSPGSWIAIFGSNLATSTASATSASLVNGYLPTTLGGASVTIDGKAAYLVYASPTQINVEAPSDSGTGSVVVAVTTSAGTATATATLSAVLPGLFTSGNYVAAVRASDSTIINGTGATVSGYTTAAAASPGDVLEIYATGLGATTTAVAPGLVFTGSYPTSATPTVTIGGTAAVVSYSGLVGAALDQINVTVPAMLMPGTYPVVITQNGVSSSSTAVLMVAPGMGTGPGGPPTGGGGGMAAGCSTTGSGTTPTIISLAASSSSANAGSSVTLTATISNSASTGTVTFYQGSTSLGTGTLSGGKASLVTSSLATGINYITATYAGDSTYAGSCSLVTAITINAASSVSTVTTLSSSAASATFGTALTLTSTVAPAASTGTVTFYDGAVPIGSGTLSGGVATLTTAALTTGTHTLAAVYAGSTSYSNSSSSSSIVTVTSAGSCTAQTGVAQVVCLANAFEATLTTTQISTLQYTYTLANVEHWSNLPLTVIARNGLQFSTLTSAQLGAALALAQAALSSDGYERLQEIRGSDSYITAINTMFQWGAPNYFVAFYGTPSTTSPWMLQINGHHFALNHTYNGTYASASPYFIGVEPPSYTLHGTTYTALEKQRAAMNALGQSVYGNTSAVLSGTFDDVVMGISGTTSIDTNYPQTYPSGTTGRGVLASSLSSAQLALIKTAIEAWVNDMDSTTAASLLSAYEDTTALANTYIGYSGDATLTKDNDYIRIDGPRVWIEFCVQQGVAFSTSFHFHTLWRDKTADYGGDFQ